MVAIVNSSLLTRLVPAGSWIEAEWMKLSISRPVRSIGRLSGMADALTSISILCMTMFSTPPRLMPGALSELMNLTGMAGLILVSGSTPTN